MSLSALILILLFALSGTPVSAAEQSAIPVLYPKAKSQVGGRVNLVLDPTADLSTIPFFQAVVNGKTEYPIVDTATGKHASQGLALEPGLNVITVRVLARGQDEKNAPVFKTVAAYDIKVFNQEGSFSGPPPGEYIRDLFHSREHEAECSGCHRLDVSDDDRMPKKPEDVLCFTCHRNVPRGRHVHGPAAVWNCMGCHNPDLYPFKYQFAAFNPWNLVRTAQTVEPLLYTFSSVEVFDPASDRFSSKERVKAMLKEVVSYLRVNPGDEVRVEAHIDPAGGQFSGRGRGNAAAFSNPENLTQAQANAVALLLRELTSMSARQVHAVGMGTSLPKISDAKKDDRELNNRVEIVVYPSDAYVKNSRNLPVLTDRERITIHLVYAQGPKIRRLAIHEKIPRGSQYVKGSGFFQGRASEPRQRGDELVWDIGDMDANFSATLYYVMTKNRGGAVSDQTRLTYLAGIKEVTRVFDAQTKTEAGMTVKETCLQCHAAIIDKKFRHGPVEAGYCNLCHDPHASANSAWLRKSAWDLCTTCHTEKASGVHVLSGFGKGKTHPTRLRPDPMRPGKRLSCASCHEPHGAESKDLFAYGLKAGHELCKTCHSKK